MSRYQSNSRDSRDSRSSNPDCKVYVGGLGSSFDKHDIEESFKSFGPLRHVWVARNPPGFAFVEFEDPLDAEDAVRGHRKRICGREVTVEMSSGERKNRRFGGPGGSRPPPRRASRNDKCYFCSDYGHFARECPKNDGRGGGGRRYSGGGGGGGGGYGGRSRDNRRSRSRTRSRSRSRSYSPRRRDSRSKSRSRSRSRSHSHHRRSSSHEKE